jgi:hypothetical protein
MFREMGDAKLNFTRKYKKNFRYVAEIKIHVC